MICVSAVDELRAAVADWKGQGHRIAFVPTMGNLHAGHLELVKQANAHADKVVVSIFVNPTQFGPDEDYENYPRTIEQDIQHLQSCDVDLLYRPDVETMYGDKQAPPTTVSVPGLNGILCGASRPGHFDGVATVVSKLFNQVQPDVALFGEKDFQQLLVIRKMCQDLAFPVQIVGVPTMREDDGLAMSSRNAYLSDIERTQAPALYRTLQELAKDIESGQRDYEGLSDGAQSRLKEAGFMPEYVAILRASDLKIPEHGDNELVILAAARLGKARLIDNLSINV